MNRRLLFSLGAATLFACGPGKSTTVNTKPTALFTFTQSATQPQSFSFDASNSSVTVGTIAKYKWLFGDEATGSAPVSVTTPSTTHTYKAAGTFTVTLVVSDDKDSDSDPVSKMVTVTSVVTTPVKAIINGPTSASPNMQLTFDGSGSTPTGAITGYTWSFGDGTAMVMGADKGIVQHSFATAGQFTVTLTVSDAQSQTDTAELHLAVGSTGPLAVCMWTPTTVSVGAPVAFDGSSSTAPGATIQVYVWDFGDGVMNVPGKMVSHTYNTMGTYTPKLQIVDSNQHANTATCADVVVGAAGLCTGMYQWSAPASGMLCGAFSGTTVDVTQSADGGITLTEPFGSSSITYSGSWTGSTFSATGMYTDMDGFVNDITINGTFAGCGSWMGTYKDSVDVGGTPVDCSWNVSATKL